ncbi:xanthine dehydrogenase family protein molybdopterin-binding subunit [Salinigranum sp. GCM10025319]|uniref:xanthine dehydrogenase family protein molybdopterin-binding subunit n=1 Tax=Salinigranum sp. GCM10025319 TaxID=3252687 RepID=UPI00360C808C
MSTTQGSEPLESTEAKTKSELFRREDYEVLTGKRKYTGDVELEGTVHAAIYRSPYAHAVIEHIDLSTALDLDGVITGFTGETLPDYVLPMSPFPFQETDPFQTGNPRIKFHDQYPLAREKVRYVGEPVAVIVAEDAYTAHDALDLIDAEFDPLPAVVDEEDAFGEDATLLYEDWGDNRQLEFEVSGGDVDAAFEEADHVIEETIKHHRFTGTPMEPRSVVAEFDASDKLVTMYDTTQIPHVITTVVEESLDVPSLKIEVHAEKLGGGYGQKWGFYPAEVLIPVLAMEIGRPVKYVERRQEHMVATSHAREQTHTIRAAFNDDGEILALDDTILANAGAAMPQGAPATHITTTMFVPGAYKIQNYHCKLYGMATNKTPFGAHRGFGKSEAAYVMERLMDIIADELQMDPAELRQANFIQPEEFPYMSVTGNRMDSGNYPEALDRALELAEYDTWREKQATVNAAEDGRYLGIGVGLCVEPSSSTRMGSYNAGYYTVRIRMDTAGQVHVFPEGADMGQSHETTISQIVAGTVGVDRDDVQVTQGDTRACPYGSGSYSSRFSVVGSSACYEAADRLATRLKRIAAVRLGVEPSELTLEDRAVHTEGGESLPLDQVARIAYQRIHEMPDDMDPGLELTHYYRDPNVTFHPDENGRVSMFSSYPYTADVAIVEVDAETGQFKLHKYVTVHDCGNILNPTVVEGQHVGALAHGFGGAMLEEMPYDDEGQPLAQTFVDYWAPSAMEMPELTMDHIETPNPFTPGGHKGAGETGTISPPPVLANAVEDALRPLGVQLRDDQPVKPQYIWEQLRKAQSA